MPGWIGPICGTARRAFSASYYLRPPPSLAELTERFRQEGEGDLLETLLTVPFKDLIERYFVSDEVKAMVCTGAMDMGDISAPGSAYITALYRFSAFREDTENYGIVRGGMGGITQSLARSAEAAGVSIRTGADVRRILVERGQAVGVQLRDGEVIEADIVLSNADPKRTFSEAAGRGRPGLGSRRSGQGAEDGVGLGQVPLRPARVA